MASRGAVFIATNPHSRREAEAAIKALRMNNELRVATLADRIAGLDDMQSSRWLKINMDLFSPFDHTLYMDADTRAFGPLDDGFGMLDDGWDMAIAPSANQGGDCLWHVGEYEAQATFKELGYLPLQLQAGIMFFAKNERTRAFFDRWRYEWRFYCDQDQAALLRALSYVPLKIWLLGRPWNGGALVAHHFGRCRQ